MRICFDLDNTLCTGTPYEEARPYPWVSKYLKELKSEGHTVIIHTARKMSTYNGNIGMVNKAICFLTLKQLEEWDFIYDEIYFGKPAADIYVDDKGLRYQNEFQLKSSVRELL